MDIVEQLRKAWPPIFKGSKLDELLGGALTWGTVQNLRTQQKIPEEIFMQRGRATLILRDPFLDWWAAKLGPAKRPPPPEIDRSRGRPRKSPLPVEQDV